MRDFMTFIRNPYNLALKDPLVYSSDYWNFPTGQPLNLNWLGQVHRGTPWQTIYLKATDILTTAGGLNTWTNWTGDLDAGGCRRNGTRARLASGGPFGILAEHQRSPPTRVRQQFRSQCLARSARWFDGVDQRRVPANSTQSSFRQTRRKPRLLPTPSKPAGADSQTNFSMMRETFWRRRNWRNNRRF